MKILNLNQKLAMVRKELTKLPKTLLNVNQNYRYFSEQQIKSIVDPLLAKYSLILEFVDDDQKNFEWRLIEERKIFVVDGWKKAIITDVDVNDENYDDETNNVSRRELPVKIYGMNSDIAKAKGSADTYAAKYFYKNFFGIEITDDLDPDSSDKKW